MLTSVVITYDGAPPDAFVLWRGYHESIVKAKKFGYDGVELALGTADDVDEHQLDKFLNENSMRVSCISTGLTYAKYGLYLTAPNNSIRNKAINAIIGLIQLAEKHGQLVTLGRVRGYIALQQSRCEVEERLADGLQKICYEASARGVQIAIEPINRYESNFINTLDEAGEYVQSLGLANLGIMADLFHMNIEDGDICAALIRNRNLLRHIHVADSNRLAPGMGHTDMRTIFDTLRHIKYGGWLSVEILPGDRPDVMALAALKAIRGLLA